MISYGTKNNSVWGGIENLFIDSGGYSFIASKKDYTTTDREYLEYIEDNNPDLFALRDYPCEPDVLKQYNRTVDDHIEFTIEKHRSLLELLDEFNISAKPVCIVQGWNLSDYKRCLDRLREEDLLTDYVGIGSVCRRNEDKRIKNIITAIRKELPSKKKLHAFGVKHNLLIFDNVVEALDSCDSLAYEYKTQYMGYISGTLTKSFRDSTLSYLKFKRKINKILKEDSSQKSISGFEPYPKSR